MKASVSGCLSVRHKVSFTITFEGFDQTFPNFFVGVIPKIRIDFVNGTDGSADIYQKKSCDVSISITCESSWTWAVELPLEITN